MEGKNKGDTSNNRSISKSFRKYISNIPGNHEEKDLQKTAISGTAHIRGLLEKYPTFGREKETGLLGALDT